MPLHDIEQLIRMKTVIDTSGVHFPSLNPEESKFMELNINRLPVDQRDEA